MSNATGAHDPSVADYRFPPQKTGEESGVRPYRPLHFGGRFCRKASMPSRKSALA